MIETKHIIAELSVQEKICLYNALYEDLASKGIDGDTELAHVNKAEMEALRAMGGSGTINPNTNLIQFGGGSPPPPPPTSQTVSQTSEFPEELKPYITDVLGKAQAIQEKREQEGYRPYEGPQIAEFTPEQQQAFTGISGLVGEGGKYFDPSTRLAAASAIAPRAGEVQQYMSPYMQNVVDIQQREAQRQADVAAQQLGAQAVSAGGFGGSRQAILEAEQQRNLQTQLGDIQARGLAAAYEDAQARIAAQRQRELAASGQFAQLGQIAPQQALKELTALEAVGAQQQALSQRGLDIAKSQFEAEQTFPERTLQQYQSVIRGFPLTPSTYTTSQTTTPAPSYLQQAAGLGATAVGLAGAFGGFSGRRAKGGLVSRMRGGQVDQNSGLGSIVVKRQAGSQIGGAQFGGMQFGGRKFGGGKYGAYNPTLKDYPYSPENVEQYKKNLRESIAKREAEQAEREALYAQGKAERRLDEERRNRISKLQQERPGLPSELFTPIEDRPALYEQQKNIDAQLRMLRNPNLGVGSPEEVSPQGGSPQVVSPQGGSLKNVSLQAVSTPSSTSDDPLLEMSVEQEPPERGDTYIPSDEVDTVGFDQSIPIASFNQQAGNIVKNKPATEKFITSFGKEISDFRKTLDERVEKKRNTAQRRKDSIERDKFLAVAQMGLNILAQDGGQTFLQAIGKGSKNVIPTLMKLSREEFKIADNLDDLDFDTLMKKYQLSKDEAAEFARKRTEDRLSRKVDADIKFNTDKINLLRQKGRVEEANLIAKRNEQLRKDISTIGKPLSKEQFKNVRDVYTGYWSEISKTDKGKSIQKLLDKTDIDLNSDQNITHLYKSARLIEQYEGLDQRSAYLKALNNFLRGISPAKNQ
jgi:hypothetical protein